MSRTDTAMFSVRRYGAAPGSHAHDHAQVLWALDGVLELEVEGRGRRLQVGDALLLHPGARHDFLSRDGCRCLVLDTAERQWLERPAQPANAAAAYQLAGYCALAVDAPELAPPALLSLLLARAWGDAGARRARRCVDWDALAQWVLANLHLPLSAADLAARALLSESQFRARCQQAQGCSPMHWVRALRQQRAHALRGAGLSVAEVARRVGYASPSALTAAQRRAQRRS